MISSARSLRISLLSPGAMGSAVGARLTEAGHRVMTSLLGRSADSCRRAADAGMRDATDEELAEGDIILSIVPPAAAAATVDRFLPLIAAARERPLFIDANALSPATKRVLAGRLGDAGCAMVDATFIGKPPTGGLCPSLFLSGEYARHALVLDLPAWRTTVLEGEVGAAAALKMCYGGINRGAIGLASVLLLAAERLRLTDALRAELQRSLPDLFARYQRQIPDMMPKAYRWVGEMEEISDFLAEDDPAGSTLFKGVAGVFAHVTADQRAEKRDVEALLRSVEAL